MRWRIAPLVLSLAASPLLAQVPMGPEFVVSTGTTTPGGSVRAAAAPDGRFAIVWSDRSRDGSGFGVFGRVFAANGQPVGEDFQVNTYTTGDQSLWFELPSVSFGGNGFVVVWGSDEQDGEWWGVFGQRFGPDGMRLGAEFQVNTQTGANQQSPSVAMAPDGRFTVVWMADPPGSSFRIFGQRYDAAGNPSGGEFVVATSANTFEPAIAMDGVGNSVVVWETGSCAGVFGQRFDAAGDRRGAEFQVTSGTSACPNGAGVAMSPDGRFVVSWGAWTQGTELDLRAQLFDASGNRVGGELLVNTYTTWSQGRHAVAMDGNGRFVLAWDPGNGGCAHARRYDAGGQPATPEFAVNPHFTLSGHWPGTAADPFGNFVIAWPYAPLPPGAAVIRARRYYGGVVPVQLTVDAAAGPASDGNGVLEACETVGMQPSWLNETAGPVTLDGVLSDFTGPPGPTYTIADGSGSYSVGSGATATCQDCYVVGVSCASPRPAPHWDATVTEAIAATPQRKPWSLHLGESFTDVPRSNPFYRFVETLLHHSVTTGCGGTAYCPSASVTREQMPVFVLMAREGQGYLPGFCVSPAPPFPDVAWNSPFCPWIQQLADRGVVSGCGNGNYCPQAPVTREQMAVFILRTLDPGLSPPACTTPVFQDVPASSPFCRWIEELARRGVVAGCGAGTYCPADPVTREQMAAFLSAAFGLSLYGPVP